MSKFIKPKSKKTLIVVGTYLVGKEKVFLEIANRISSKIYADSDKQKVLNCLENDVLSSLLCNDKTSQIHLCSMAHLTKEHLTKRMQESGHDQVLALKPTGWTKCDRDFKLSSFKPSYITPKIILLPVPYSEHSSFAELEMFVRSFKIEKIVPTVNLSPKSISKMNEHFCKWKQ
jgi:hypothetical protein